MKPVFVAGTPRQIRNTDFNFGLIRSKEQRMRAGAHRLVALVPESSPEQNHLAGALS
jgi:hypothetical protein